MFDESYKLTWVTPHSVIHYSEEVLQEMEGMAFQEKMLRDTAISNDDWLVFIEKLKTIFLSEKSQLDFFVLMGKLGENEIPFQFNRWIELLKTLNRRNQAIQPTLHFHVYSIMHLTLEGLNIGLFSLEEHKIFTGCISQLTELQHLHLNHNRLGQLTNEAWQVWSDAFVSLTSLQAMALKYNQLGAAENEGWIIFLQGLTRLRSLDLSSNILFEMNVLEKLNPIFNRMNILNFSGNDLHRTPRLPSNFFGTNIFTLLLNCNHLSEFSFQNWCLLIQSFAALPLVKLSLKNNKLNELPLKYWKEFNDVLRISLCHLNVSQNQLRTIYLCLSFFHGPTQLHNIFFENQHARRKIVGLNENLNQNRVYPGG